MFSIFGKKKIKGDFVAKVFVDTINDAALNGYPTVLEYLHDETEFERKPMVTLEQIEWFLFITFTVNLRQLNAHFDKPKLAKIRISAIDEFVESLEGRDADLTVDQINSYEDFITSIQKNETSWPKIMALAIFHKFDLAKYQIEHFRNLNEPNPKIIKNLTEITQFFVWNWEDLMAKYKMAI